MLIRCPKCNVSYDIGAANIPAEGKKVRCSQCGEIWLCSPADLIEEPQPEIVPPWEKAEEPAAPETETPAAEKTSAAGETPPEQEAKKEPEPAGKSEMQEIFARLETQTESLFEYEKKLPPHKRLWYRIKCTLGLQRRRNRRVLAGASVVLFFLLLFYLRFDIVRVAPFMEKVYAALNIESVIPGEGLEFQNITRNEYEEDYVNKMEIRGFIANVSDETRAVPTIQVELLDKNVQALQVLYQEPPVPRVVAGGKVAFQIIVTKPSSFSKYVYLTFTREHPEGTLKAVGVHPDEI